MNYESNSSDPDDEALFDNLQNVITADVHDRVDAGNESFNHNQVQLLNGATNGVVGSVLTIPVGAGDKISAEVYAKYLAPTGTSNPAAAIGNLVIGAITGTTGTGIYEGAITSGYGSGGTVTSLINTNASSTEPMAFINLLFLPDDVTGSIATDHFAFKQITSASSNSQAILALDQPYEAPESGYVVIYLSNESAQLTEVYFDDLKITVNEHPVIQTDDYYPFGLTFNSYQRVTAKENRFLYNQGTGDKVFNTERIIDLELNMDMTKYRMYDYAIGRFTSIDPLADAAGQEILTPYHYAFNNPLRYSDPLGDCSDPNDPDCIAAQQAGSGQTRSEQRQRKVYGAIADATDQGLTQASTLTDLNDAAVLSTLVTRGGDAVNVDGSEASTSDKIFAAVGVLIPGVSGSAVKKVGGKIVDKVAQLFKNKEAGKAFEKQVGNALDGPKADQVTIEAADGSRTRVDFVQNNGGDVSLTEAKGSATAPLTPKQKAAHPQIEQSGGVIRGNKGQNIGLPAGTKIPPTKVNVVRPDDIK